MEVARGLRQVDIWGGREINTDRNSLLSKFVVSSIWAAAEGSEGVAVGFVHLSLLHY